MLNWAKNSLELVEGTRPRRVNQPAPVIDDTEGLLRKFHPDHSGRKRMVMIGANAGRDFFPVELADMLEADSLLADSFKPGSDIETDVLIIGGGGAGTAAALELEGSGLNVHLACKLRLGDSNTVMAEGGIQAALADSDSPQRHFSDAFVGGHGKNIPELLRPLCESGPDTIQWLTGKGCLFDRAKNGRHILHAGGGTSTPRVLACRDYTGLEIMRVLKDALGQGRTKILEKHSAVELLDDGQGNVSGAVLLNSESKTLRTVLARAVLLATGGSGQLRLQGFPTSNHFGATGDGLVLAYRQGCFLINPDSHQYHPSGACFPEALVGQLLTEGIRSMGAQILNAQGQRFVDEMTYRDVIASAIIQECVEGRGVDTPSGRKGVWLDTPLIDSLKGEGTVRSQFPGLVHRFSRYDIWPDKKPILIYPTLHYQNGGVRIDSQGKTDKGGLWAAGEVSGGVHGTNRLMGNSLLDIIVFGRRAAMCIRDNLPERTRAGLFSLNRFREERKNLPNLSAKESPQLFPKESQIKIKLDVQGGEKGFGANFSPITSLELPDPLGENS